MVLPLLNSIVWIAEARKGQNGGARSNKTSFTNSRKKARLPLNNAPEGRTTLNRGGVIAAYLYGLLAVYV